MADKTMLDLVRELLEQGAIAEKTDVEISTDGQCIYLDFEDGSQYRVALTARGPDSVNFVPWMEAE